jgi:hypothetical protein
MQEEVSRRERDGPADDDDVDDELREGEFQVEGALGAARERENDVEHDAIDRDAVECTGDEWVIEQEWQALRGDNVDGGDDQRNEEVESEAEDRGAPIRFEGTRTEKSAGHALEDALRFDLEGYGGLQAGRGGIEDAAGEGGGEDCLHGLGHLAAQTVRLDSPRTWMGANSKPISCHVDATSPRAISMVKDEVMRPTRRGLDLPAIPRKIPRVLRAKVHKKYLHSHGSYGCF